MNDWQDIVIVLVAWLVVAGLGALVLGGWWWLVPTSRAQRLTMQRSRRVSWYGIDVFAAFFLLELIPLLVFLTLQKAGLFEWLYPGADDKTVVKRGKFWATALGPPLVFGLIVLGLQQLRHTRPVELGLTRVRATVNLRLAYKVWLVVTPTAYVLLYAAEYLVMMTGGMPEQHPVELGSQESLGAVDWLLMIISAVLTMPILEELVFRGLLLPWQVRGGWQAQVTVAFCAVFVAAVLGDRENGYNAGALLFVLVILAALLLVPYLLMRGVLRPSTDPELDHSAANQSRFVEVFRCAGDPRALPVLAIGTNGLFFAAMHSQVWPSPVALFPLGMALAWLRYRTSSLVGPVTLHILFNAVATLAVIFKAAA